MYALEICTYLVMADPAFVEYRVEIAPWIFQGEGAHHWNQHGWHDRAGACVRFLCGMSHRKYCNCLYPRIIKHGKMENPQSV